MNTEALPLPPLLPHPHPPSNKTKCLPKKRFNSPCHSLRIPPAMDASRLDPVKKTVKFLPLPARVLSKQRESDASAICLN